MKRKVLILLSVLLMLTPLAAFSCSPQDAITEDIYTRSKIYSWNGTSWYDITAVAGGGNITGVTGTLPITSTGGAAPDIGINYDAATLQVVGGDLGVIPGLYLTIETDPIFIAHVASNITAANITAWNTSYVPYIGATGNVTLGAYSLITTGISGFNAYGDIFTDRWLWQNSNTFLGVDVIGNDSLAHTVGAEGYNNTIIGNSAGYMITTGSFNNAWGTQSLFNLTTGSGNTAFGVLTGNKITTGSYNTMIGYLAGPTGSNTTYGLFIDAHETDTPLIGGNFTSHHVTINGELFMAANQIHNVLDPTLAQDAATKNYVDNSVTGNLTGYVPYTGATTNLNLGSYNLITTGNVTTGTLYVSANTTLGTTLNVGGTVTMPTPFTLGVTSVNSTGTQLNYLNAVTGTTGTTNTNLVFSTSPTLTTPTLDTAVAKGTWTASGTWTIPAITLGAAVTLNGQVLDAGSGRAYIDTTGDATLDLRVTNEGILGAQLIGRHISTTPATNDALFRMSARGYDVDTPQNSVTYGYLDFLVEAATADAHSGKLSVVLYASAVANQALTLSSAGALWIDSNLTIGGQLMATTLGGSLTLNGKVFDAGAGNAQINTTGALNGLMIQSTQDGAGGAVITGRVISASPAGSDSLLRLAAEGRNTTPATSSYGYMEFRIVNPTTAIQEGQFIIVLKDAGADNVALRLYGAGDLWIDRNLLMDTGYIRLTEMAAPGALGVNTVGIYAIVGGDTLTDLAAVFQDGTVDIFAQESTEPDSPIFEFPDMTDLKLQLRKPDRKTVQFAAIFPDGREFIMRELRYPSPRWN